MLLHSRGGSGKMEPTDLNALIKEYTNLSFHGMRAGKHPINVGINLELDEHLAKVPLIAEDFSRVILNLCNNAFDAMREKLISQNGNGQYVPSITIRTIQEKNFVSINVEDNGPGIPEEFKDKILQPFFTTKPTGQGTGLGLSLSYDIVKAHGGELKVETKEGEASTFIIQLPV
jgi:signal transduction histidine kinase